MQRPREYPIADEAQAKRFLEDNPHTLSGIGICTLTAASFLFAYAGVQLTAQNEEGHAAARRAIAESEKMASPKAPEKADAEELAEDEATR